MKHEAFSRRCFLGTIAASCAALRGAIAEAKQPRPNILFIMTDQQHAGLVKCAGDPWIKTPALDRLAASGIRLERTYATNPICIPSRFSLQTGRMPSVIGMVTNEELPVFPEIAEHNLGALLKGGGYDTAYGGKVHLPKDMRDTMFPGGYRMLTADRRQDLADTACAYLNEPHDKPFFLFVSFINPHDICYMPLNDVLRGMGKPPIDNEDSNVCEAVLDQARKSGDLDAFVERYCPPLPDNFEIPDGEAEAVQTKYVDAATAFGGLAYRKHCREEWNATDWRLFRWCYRRLMEMVDQQIGQVVDAVCGTGLARDTLIIYTSDHGEMDGAHRLEHKSLPYEESARVPFIASWEGVISPGSVDEKHLVSNGLDLLPTLCDYARVEAPADLAGRSLRPILEGKEPRDWRKYLVLESANGRMVRTARYKYTIYDSGADRETLVDLENDPGEMENLAGHASHADILRQHQAHLAEWIVQQRDSAAARYYVRG